jgi:hypothetical protein
MNFNFDALDGAAIAKCSPQNRAAAARGHGFLLRYEDLQIRSTVRRQLDQMRRSGFQAIRTLVWFGKSTEGAGRSSSNMFAIDAPEVAARNVALFADDVRQAGFSRLYLAFGPQGTSAPACRRQQWGDCFDGGSIAESVNFITRVRQALGPSVASMVYVDLQNEGGLTHFHPDAARSNMARYLSALVGAYLRQFPEDRTTVSVQQRNATERIAAVSHVYEQYRRRPAFLEFHIYDVRPAELNPVTAVLRSLPQRFPVVVGEFPYGDAAAVEALESQIGPQLTQESSNLPILFWPLRNPSGACGIDTAPPYDLNWIGPH